MFHGSNIFFDFKSGGHYFMAAAHTPQAKIRPGSQNLPAEAAAGMGLFHEQYVIDPNIHTYFPLMASQYALAACSVLLGPYS